MCTLTTDFRQMCKVFLREKEESFQQMFLRLRDICACKEVYTSVLSNFVIAIKKKQPVNK